VSSADGQLYFPLWFHSVAVSRGRITSHIREVDSNQSCEEAAAAGWTVSEGEPGAGGNSKAGTWQRPHYERHSPTTPKQEEQSRLGDG